MTVPDTVVFETLKFSGEEVPPPGAGVNTVIGNEPAVVKLPAGTLAVKCDESTNVVVRFEPFHCTTEVLMKFDPVTESVKPGDKVTLLLGLMDANEGTALLMLNAKPAEVNPTGLVTVTVATPAVATSAAEIDAVNCVPLTYVVVRAAPFHLMTEPL